ncbi:MAG: NusG domain II-containing protein [Clostridia bacterium]|nr:NusG domain II-containing protein [Clostridia bacterium]
MKLKLFRKADIIIIAAVIAVSGVFILLNSFDDSSLNAEITVNGKLYETVDLNAVNGKRVIIPDTDPHVVIVAEKGKIRFESAECKDKICVKAGNLTHKGDVAVCLPSGTVISITDSATDAVTY